MENKYTIKLLPRAYLDLEGIYAYITETLIEPGIAAKLADSLENAIFSLEGNLSYPRNPSVLGVETKKRHSVRCLF